MSGKKTENKSELFDVAGTMLMYAHDQSWPRLRSPAYQVWGTLMSLRLQGLPVVMASRREIGKAAGIRGYHTVGRALKELLDKGYLRRLSRPSGDRMPVPFLLLDAPEPPSPAKAKPAGQGAAADPDAGASVPDLDQLTRDVDQLLEEFFQITAELPQPEREGESLEGRM